MEMKWRIFPITENGIKTNYMTDAPIQVLSNSFRLSRNIHDFIEILQELDFELKKHFPSVELDFDNN